MDGQLLRDACLLADAETIGKLLAVAIPIFIVVGRALIGYMQKQGQPPRPAAQRPARPPGNAPRPAGGNTPADEVEEFLKRVAQRRGEKPAPRVEVARPQSAPVERPTPPVPKQRRGRSVQPSGEEAKQPPRESTLDSRKFEDRAAQLSSVDRADENMLAHVQSVFEHPIGQFGTETITDESPGQQVIDRNSPGGLSQAEQLAQTLRSVDGVRQAVLLAEVLRRPTHRWQ